MDEGRRDVQFGIMMNKIEKLEETQSTIMEQQAAIMDELSLYKHFIMFVKALGYTIAAVLAFKFGSIKDFWGGK